MNKFLNYYNSLCYGANSPSVFSFDPFFIAMKELIISELEQVVYYIEKLKTLDIDMKEYTDKVIDFISVLIVNLDFNKESFFVITKDLYKNKKSLEELYKKECQKLSLEPELLNSYPEKDLSNKESILKALNECEKNTDINKENLTLNKKNLYEIMINLVLKACNNLIDLKNYGINLEEAKNQVLKLINTTNFPSLNEEEQKNIIKDFSKCNYHIMKTLYETIIEKYGPIIKTQVNIGTKKGKAILVSGCSFLDLEKILKQVKGTEINVYTHHEMLSAFQYEKLRNSPNLTAHYQKSTNNFPLDFSTFPGPIYISKNATPKIDIIRGQIYTSAKYPYFGIAKIENDDFSPLIKYALSCEGFKEDKELQNLNIGYDLHEIEEKTQNIINNLNNTKIKKLTIIGVIDRLSPINEYIKTFYDECSNDNFIISFAQETKRENFWQVNSYYDFAVVYKIIEKLSEKITNLSDILSIYLTDCNSSTISHIFNLIHLNIKKIFLGPCCPNIINPSLIDGLKELYNIKPLTTPKEDMNI